MPRDLSSGKKAVLSCERMSKTPRKILEGICASRGRVAKADLFKALEFAGCEITRRGKQSHFMVKRPGYPNPVIIATKRDEVLPVYVSRVVNELQICDVLGDE